ncbi:MAG: DUF6519 domain-containing protein [Verrucomicrobia bacterium]|nr:DUF6519 domain-containing protein [Verrucomicrobiota bacterium]
MKADLTRDTFDAKNHFRQVLAQQGRVQLDAELNEQSALSVRRDETAAADIVGRCGGPAETAAFGMSAIAGQPGDFLLAAGRYYADGIQCELEAPVSYRQQPDLRGLPVLPAGAHLAYLDVWQRHLTFLDDPRLLETALGGVDTTTRLKTVWQVRAVPVNGALECSAAYAEYTARTRASTIRMRARTQPVAGADDPCQIAEGSGYTSLENQLYRVEVHSLQTADQARGVGRAAVWKWSRENASVEVALKAVDVAGKKLTVSSLGRDEKLGIRKGHFVEITDDSRELSGLHGDLIEVDDVDEGDLTITLLAAPAILTTVKPALHPRARRWEGTANVQTNAWLDLEAGIQVKFADVNLARPGDYWQIPARTSAPGAQAGTIEWPQTVPGTADALLQRGIQHHYCRLGFVTVSAVAPVFTDCRCLWPALTAVPRLFYVSGDGQEVMPDLTAAAGTRFKLPRPLIVGVANSHCLDRVFFVRFEVVNTGSSLSSGLVVATVPGGAPTQPFAIVPLDAEGLAKCDFHLDGIHPVQQVTARLLDANNLPVSLPLILNANLSIASHVAYQPGGCAGLAGRKTVQAAIDRLASMASIYKISGDGQQAAAGLPLNNPLRVRVASRCGPVAGRPVTFQVVQGGGSAAPNSSTTDASGEVTCEWQLGGDSVLQVMEAEVMGDATEPRKVHFVAHLTVEASNDPAPVRVVGAKFIGSGKQLSNDATITLADLGTGLAVLCDRIIDESTVLDPAAFSANRITRGQPTCFITAEIPFPLFDSDLRDFEQWDLKMTFLVGYRPVILHALVKTQVLNDSPPEPDDQTPRSQIEWYPDNDGAVLGFLSAVLAQLNGLKPGLDRLLLRLTLKGNFIWNKKANDLSKSGIPGGFLDGETFRAASGFNTHQLILPSGDNLRGGDFEMWFWLAARAPKVTDIPKATEGFKAVENVANPAGSPAATKKKGTKTRAKRKTFIQPKERSPTGPGK